MIKIKTLSTKNSILILILALALGGSFIAYTKIHNSSPKQIESPTGSINLSPSTQEDKKGVEENKQRLLDAQNTQKNADNATAGGKKVVKPVITYAGIYNQTAEVGGYAPDVFETTATCTANFQNGSKSFTKSVQAVQGANSMDCPVITVNNNEFPVKGNWQVVLSYSSSSASGTSEPKQIQVQ